MSISKIDLTHLEMNYEEIPKSINPNIANQDNQVEEYQIKTFGFPTINKEKDDFNIYSDKNYHNIQKERTEETNSETNEIFNEIIKYNINNDFNFNNSNGNLPINDFMNRNLASSNNINNLGNSNNIDKINVIIENRSFPNNKNKKENKILIINKKRRYFNVVYPNTFFIFHKGGNDKYIRKYIEVSLKMPSNEKENLFPFKSSKKQKRNRKEKADLIRKKIKAKFLKNLRQQANKKLNLGGSLKKFNFLQQIFISNITKEVNGGVLDLTFKELYSLNFCKYEIDGEPNLQKFNDNVSVIKYLEERPEISKKSNYEIFKDLKYYQIYEEYLRSKEFENEIIQLMKNFNYEYIRRYIKLAFGLNDFFNY